MTEVQLPQEDTTKQSNRKLIWWLAGGGCLLLMCTVVFVGVVLWAGPQFAGLLDRDVVTPEAGDHPQATGNTMGDPGAPVHIIEYADFQCPYCLRFWEQTEPQIIETYISTGKVYFEYRSVGAFIGPESAAAAEAAYCAGDQGKFWEYHDTLYSNWTGENVGDFARARLHQYAGAVGLDQKAFDKCLADGVHAGTVQEDVDNAQADGIQATPSFLINGKLVEGAQPFSVFQQEIDAALQGQ